MQTNAGSADVVLSLETTETEALTDNIRLEPYQMEVPENIIDISGPYGGRMWTLTSEGYVYMSSLYGPSMFNSRHVIDLTRYGDPLWMSKTGNGMYVGMEKDVIYIAGTGEESEDMGQIDYYPQELNVGNPPIDACHLVDGNTIVYRSNDGLMVLTGSSLEMLPTAGTSLLWRGQDRHSVNALNTSTGRFRMAIDNHMLYMLAPEGDATESAGIIYRYSFPKEQWSRLRFAEAGNLRSIFNDPDGALILGDDEGVVWLLEDTNSDNGQKIFVELLTPIEDGGDPLLVKDAFDVQLHANTGSDDAAVELFKDGNAASTQTLTANTSQSQVWRGSANSFGEFVKAQMQISGSFSEFRLHRYNLSYRPRPQRMTYLDTGYFVSSGDLVWVQEIEVDGIFTSDFTVELYFNDVQFDLGSEASVTASANVRDVYQIPVPRGAKGERPRVVVKSDDTEGTDIGFDPYFVRIRELHTGNEDGNRSYDTVWPVGQVG
jgi:hypothetical protein